jgi:hypothetical protein
MKAQAIAAPKKPYQAPKLLIYGSLTEMTRTRTSNARAQKDTVKKVAKNRT